ncbi:condensin complex subunit SMC2 [Gloeophyllum trabeum ATCC 11539]|uniref:Structural maintenance of chromosomes protein n=1 Tax=Gloeophyllum trabeum (strain ATCC 11539 / FP-39264 / Madison 617) TaxID=670483 RepID=S7Q0N2_GLOTA|nr:condensin complex subunit SMC2 [Gloeophyllum trabeum ATCC 11539]EPQ53318.1 condensin complex subunit SMC2 [Gloeophyllum trabeum ATCC 11539]
MRIEELVLEGFKSYPVRTQITGWDPSFNAITGLNGSGKSNILDAICFVLGMTNTSAMRAQNQQDLIYKRGQAGITKASVTIVFDNSDRATSPPGMENCKQITVTRQIALPNISKYLLNGHKSQQHTIQTLFQSVQLNINNPNFLIMQGRITKVLNMRPQEILGMIEEAAGTRMFEERKDKAKKTMGKKDKRVQEINSLLAEEITPKLDGLRAEKRAFLQWQKACSELERIGRLLRAWEWTEGNQRVERKQAEIEKKEKEMKRIQKDRGRYVKEGDAAEKQCEQLNAQRDKELKKGGKFKKLEEEVGELEKVLVKIRTQVEIKEGTISDEEGKVMTLEKELKETEEALAEKHAQVEHLQTSYDSIKEKHTETQNSLTTSEELLQSLLTGLGANHAGGGGYMGQLADAKARLAQATAEEEQCKTKLGLSEKELKALQARWKEVEREAGDSKRNLEVMKTEVETLRDKVAQSGWSAEKEREGQEALQSAKDEVRRLTEQRDAVKQRLSSLSFDYTSPRPNFDRSKVKGLVASLISLDPSDYNKSTALEITAGGKLYNVIVDDNKVGEDLLKNGGLKRRVTILPLNKIDNSRMHDDKVRAAERLAPGKVRLALSLVGYPEEVSNAMNFVFGKTLICDDAQSAKLVTFSKEVGGARSVTLDGDVYDPSGTLTGGAAPSASGVLVKVQELLDAEAKLNEAKSRLDALEREEERSRSAREKWKKLVRELEIKEHELRLLEEQVGGSNAARLSAQIDEMKSTIAELQASVQAAKEKQKSARDECKKLEKDMDEFKNNKEGKIDELKADIAKQKAALQKQAVVVKTQQKEVHTATLELEQFDQDIESAKANLDEARAGIEQLREELSELTQELTKREAAHAKVEAKLREERATLTRFDNELKELDKVIQEKKQAVADADLAVKKLEHDIQTLSKEKTTASNFVANLEKMHEWIAEDHELFGTPGSQYDFASVDIPLLREKAAELEDQQKGMKKKVNPKVLNMIDSVEKKEAALKKMLSTVMKDKEKIEETIEELDRYKLDALEKTWTKVNGDFGGIFAELLPGNFAKLQPPEGQDLTQGLEVKVQLGSVWKQSLTELSGGQRSLIALSLIMSLLQFKPAPMYILDEIDAALDLSHTQHIGHLFRTRFKGSQFIVVSLKEGLFTNANVLFRTRFRDGTSIVERTAQRSTSALYAGEKDSEGDERAPRRGRRGVA